MQKLRWARQLRWARADQHPKGVGTRHGTIILNLFITVDHQRLNFKLLPFRSIRAMRSFMPNLITVTATRWGASDWL